MHCKHCTTGECVRVFVCLQSPCVGNPLMGIFVFVAVCAEGREVMANCVPYPPFLFFFSHSLSLIQIKFLMGFIGATVE